MAHAGQPDEFFEVPGDKLWAIIGNDSWLCLREFLSGSLQDDLDILLDHGWTQFPVYDVAAAAIKNGAQVVKGAKQIDIRDIDMPMLMRFQRLNEARSLTAAFSVPAAKKTGRTQYAIHTAGTYGDDIAVKHHIGQAAIAFQWILVVEIDDRLLLPVFEPEITGNQGVMLVDLAIAALPVVILAGCNPQPLDKSRHGDAALFRPAMNEIDDGITDIMGNPGRG